MTNNDVETIKNNRHVDIGGHPMCRCLCMCMSSHSLYSTGATMGRGGWAVGVQHLLTCTLHNDNSDLLRLLA